MSFPRPVPSHTRSMSLANQPSASQSAALQARVNEKKAELASLKELQALSASVADQMHTLEKKLSTLSDGTEAIATVLANWNSVLRAIQLASSKIPKPKDPDATDEPQLPNTLVRIPTEHASVIQQTVSDNTPERT